MILYIDTTDFNEATFGIADGKKIIWRVFKIDPHKSHETLAKLDEFLRSVKIKSTFPAPSRYPPHVLGRGIRKIYVNKGPGSYTGVRVGVTISQALGFAWGVKVSALGAADYTRIATLK